MIIHWNSTSSFDYKYIVKMDSFNEVSLSLNHNATSRVGLRRVEQKIFRFGC